MTHASRWLVRRAGLGPRRAGRANRARWPVPWAKGDRHHVGQLPRGVLADHPLLDPAALLEHGLAVPQQAQFLHTVRAARPEPPFRMPE